MPACSQPKALAAHKHTRLPAGRTVGVLGDAGQRAEVALRVPGVAQRHLLQPPVVICGARHARWPDRTAQQVWVCGFAVDGTAEGFGGGGACLRDKNVAGTVGSPKVPSPPSQFAAAQLASARDPHASLAMTGRAAKATPLCLPPAGCGTPSCTGQHTHPRCRRAGGGRTGWPQGPGAGLGPVPCTPAAPF